MENNSAPSDYQPQQPPNSLPAANQTAVLPVNKPQPDHSRLLIVAIVILSIVLVVAVALAINQYAQTSDVKKELATANSKLDKQEIDLEKAKSDNADLEKQLQSRSAIEGLLAENKPAATTQALVDKVSLLTALPTDETPTVATVTDITKLQGQPFFAKAQNGDKVLIYTKNKKAILYRETTNEIINTSSTI